MRRRISATPLDQLSAFHWMPFGEQALPVRSDEEAESKMTSRLRAFAEILDRQRDARIGDVENRPHSALVVPLARNRKADVDLVLMVGDEEFDRLAKHGAAEILDRHARDLHRAGTGQIGVRPGLVVHDADDESLTGAREVDAESATKESAAKTQTATRRIMTFVP